MNRLAILSSAALGAVLATAALHAQKPEGGGPPPQQHPVVHENELTLLHYVPKTSAADTLTELAYSMWGRTFVTAADSSHALRNIFQNVDSVVIYDEKGRADRILKMLKGLDGAQQRKDSAPVTTVLLRLEYATTDEAKSILRPFMRSILLPSPNREPQKVTNIEFIESRSTVIVRDDKETVDAIREMLAQFDTPRPQVMLTAWVIRAGAQAVTGDLTLPDEVLRNLSKLVPIPTFQGLGMGLVNTTVHPKEEISLGVSLGDYGRAELRMTPRAFDESSATLHLKRCSCQLQLRDPTLQGKRWNGGQLPVQTFSTQVSLRDGEYTVLGAVGSKPVFVVLKMAKTPRAAATPARVKPN